MTNEKLSLHENKNSFLISYVFEMSVRIGILETGNVTPEDDPSTSEYGK